MPNNPLGNFVRERRVVLGLTQEQLAERIGGSASQAEISRLERGEVLLPRRHRLEALAEALEVSLGAMLMASGWLAEDEGRLVDGLPQIEEGLGHAQTMALLDELTMLREQLLAAIERIGALERVVRDHVAPGERTHVPLPTGTFDDWEKSDSFVA
jgi:transcriptional regulator with XRE-family HTH domain